ncbi:MAG: tetratricopeptide repeat protein, partial [SAR202 cluster bacterium]|nr:tetratricopeptide repeat protein [SAR202 cluster bacterium]
MLAQRAAQRKPKDPEAWNALAVAYSMSGKDRQATETFLKSLEAFPKHRRLKLNAAAHFGKLKDWPRAETQARAALAMPPQDGIARSLLATLLLRQGRTQEGEQELLRLTRERPEDPGPHFVLGKVRMGQKNVAGARAAFEEAARIRPKEPLPQIYIGMTYLLSNDLPGAERSYEKA